jgi:hypothetical protein
MAFTSNIRKTTLAALAAVILIAAGSTLAPTQAQAGGNNWNAFIGGAIVGSFIGATSQSAYNPYYPGPVYTSCFTRWETRYNYYGQPYQVKVKYC